MRSLLCHQNALGHHSESWALGRQWASWSSQIWEALLRATQKQRRESNNLICMHQRTTLYHLDGSIRSHDFKSKQDWPGEFCQRQTPPRVSQFLEIGNNSSYRLFQMQTSCSKAHTPTTSIIGLSHWRPHYSPAHITPGPGTRQPGVAPVHQSPLKWSRLTSPNPAYFLPPWSFLLKPQERLVSRSPIPLPSDQP